MRQSLMHMILGIAVLMLACATTWADVSLNALFTDNMVLQRDMPVAVWGKAAADEEVTVTIANQTHTGKADVDGRWIVNLAPMPAGGPHEMTVAAANSVTLKNILIGEVWVASGQSNMEFGMGHAINSAEEIAAADYPQLRLYTVRTQVAATPQEDLTGDWQVCTPETVQKYSALAYFFGRDLQQTLGVPVGIVHSSVSGTTAEAWIRPEALQGNPILQPILDRYAASVAQYPQDVEKYPALLAAWEEAVKQATADGTKAPVKPRAPADPATLTTRPGGLWNGKIAPLTRLAMRGVIWWQAEYNSERSEQYKTLFPALIHDWRAQWGQGDFPFLFVQLQNLDIQPQPNKAKYFEMRDAQLYSYRTVPNTGMAMAVDVGKATDIHPPNKQEVARRLVLIARAKVYGEALIYSGPLYDSMTVEGEKARIAFTELADGLVSKTGETLASFTIAGEDKIFHQAQAIIEENTVLVWSPDVAKPVAVRYAWADDPVCSLYNLTGLPASPFRTDDWPLESFGNW